MIRDIPNEVYNLVLLTLVLADEINAVNDFDKLMAVFHTEKRLLYYHFEHLISLFVQLLDVFELQ